MQWRVVVAQEASAPVNSCNIPNIHKTDSPKGIVKFPSPPPTSTKVKAGGSKGNFIKEFQYIQKIKKAPHTQ
ncbi:MAG: hypothetical protein HOD16_08395 [Nitrospina sp.]|nr:hypothetical protein [Nitrospina sp.]